MDTFLKLGQMTKEQQIIAIERLIKKKQKNVIAVEIGNRIKKQFEKKQNTFNKECCKTCGQKIPNRFTQLWLADKMGVSKATLCHILQGNRLPTLEQIVSAAVVLNCSVDYLLIDLKKQFEKLNK